MYLTKNDIRDYEATPSYIKLLCKDMGIAITIDIQLLGKMVEEWEKHSNDISIREYTFID